MQRENGFSGRVAPDLDVAKSESAPAGAECFHGRLLRRESAGDVFGAGAPVPPGSGELSRTEDPFDEPLAPAVEDIRDAIDFREIDAEKELQPARSR